MYFFLSRQFENVHIDSIGDDLTSPNFMFMEVEMVMRRIWDGDENSKSILTHVDYAIILKMHIY